MSDRSPPRTRREFLKTTAVAGVAAAAQPRLRAARRRNPLDQLNVAVIGAGGKGHSDMRAVKRTEAIVALCDVDEERCARARDECKDARFYHDYRDLLDSERDLDAVVISTPDHIHAVAAVAAMQRGLHVFCQKPLTHSVEEARVLRETAERTGVVTQMGNQGTARDGFRRGVEVLRAGVLGEIKAVHVWTNRPIWPQGIDRPAEILPIPKTLRWDLWLGPAPYRPYSKGYAPFAWRGWWDFGTGALGDMACHLMNLPYFALELGAPESIEAEVSGIHAESAPLRSTIRYVFPARGDRGPVPLIWYDGADNKPDPAMLPGGGELSRGGSLIVGERGVMYSSDDYGSNYKLLPEERFAGLKLPEPMLPRAKGIQAEWIEAIRGGPETMSGFDHAGPFTEAVLLGNVALRAGERIEWNSAEFRTGSTRADAFLRDSYRRGYSIGI